MSPRKHAAASDGSIWAGCMCTANGCECTKSFQVPAGTDTSKVKCSDCSRGIHPGGE